MVGETQTYYQPQQQQQQQQLPGMIPFTPIMPTFPTWNMGGGDSTNVDISLSGKDGKEYLENAMPWKFGEKALGAVVNTIGMGLQYGLASQAMDNQYKIANKYYETQGTIASYQRDVALSQLNVQFEAVNAQQRMHEKQVMHEETMSRLEGTAQARLASIAEQGKTDRAKILATTDAFSRRGYDYGFAHA